MSPPRCSCRTRWARSTQHRRWEQGPLRRCPLDIAVESGPKRLLGLPGLVWLPQGGTGYFFALHWALGKQGRHMLSGVRAHSTYSARSTQILPAFNIWLNCDN